MSALARTDLAFLVVWSCLVLLSLCGVTSDIGWLERFKLEQLAMLGALGLAPLLVWQKRAVAPLDKEFLALWLPGLLFLLCVFHAEMYALHPGEYLMGSHFRHVMKVYILVPIIWFVLREINNRTFVIALLATGITILCGWSLLAWNLGYLTLSTERMILDTRHGDPNFLATYAGATIFIWAHLWRSTDKFLYRVGCASGIVVLLTLMVQSGSRMGMLSLLAGGIVLGAIEANKSRQLLPIAIAGALVLVLVGVGAAATERLADFTIDRAIEERFLSLEAGWQAFSQKPLTGWGVHATPSFFYRFSEYPLFEASVSALDLHNTWMQCLAELGVFGLIAYVGLWAVGLWRVMKAQATLLAVALVVAMLGMSALPGTYDDILPMFPLLLGLVYTRADDYCTTSI